MHAFISYGRPADVYGAALATAHKPAITYTSKGPVPFKMLLQWQRP
jgi:hypothetical protein